MAQRFGAKRDLATGQWYVLGGPPAELLNLLSPPVSRTREPDRSVPGCPVHRVQMVKRHRKADGDAFWGCPRYPDCRQVIDYTDYLDTSQQVPRTDAEALVERGVPEQQRAGATRHAVVGDELKTRVAGLIELAGQQIEDPRRVQNWFTTAKRDLQWQTPLQAMVSIDGCDAVEALLRALYR